MSKLAARRRPRAEASAHCGAMPRSRKKRGRGKKQGTAGTPGETSHDAGDDPTPAVESSQGANREFSAGDGSREPTEGATGGADAGSGAAATGKDGDTFAEDEVIALQVAHWEAKSAGSRVTRSTVDAMVARFNAARSESGRPPVSAMQLVAWFSARKSAQDDADGGDAAATATATPAAAAAPAPPAAAQSASGSAAATGDASPVGSDDVEALPWRDEAGGETEEAFQARMQRVYGVGVTHIDDDYDDSDASDAEAAAGAGGAPGESRERGGSGAAGAAEAVGDDEAWAAEFAKKAATGRQAPPKPPATAASTRDRLRFEAFKRSIEREAAAESRDAAAAAASRRGDAPADTDQAAAKELAAAALRAAVLAELTAHADEAMSASQIAKAVSERQMWAGGDGDGDGSAGQLQVVTPEEVAAALTVLQSIGAVRRAGARKWQQAVS